MLVTSLVTLKFISSALAKDMVNLDVARRVGSNLLNASKQIASNLLQNEESARSSGSEGSLEGDEVKRKRDEPLARSTEYLVYHWFEALFAWFQMVILWHDPIISLCAISCYFTSFLFLTYFAPRFYSTVLFSIFVYNATRVWFRHVWPEIRVPPKPEQEEEARIDVDRWTYLHPQLMTLAELGQATSNLMKTSEFLLQKSLTLRREKPIAFYLTIFSILSCTAHIGNRISGSNLIFSLTTALIIAPGIYLHLLPRATKVYIRHKIILPIFQGAQESSPQEQALLRSEPEESSSSSSSSSSSYTSPPLSLFEHLRKHSSFLMSSSSSSTSHNQEQQPPNLETNGAGSATIPQSSLAETPAIQVPIKAKDELIEGEAIASNRQTEPPRSSSDLSSNESTSLIDFEEEQQDGFVIL